MIKKPLLGKAIADASVALENKPTLKKDTTPYERELVESVAYWLRMGAELCYVHPDYCGTGFLFTKDKFLYGEYHDGECCFIINSFASEILFVQWLTKQSDQSLARLEDKNHYHWDNQVITRERLVKFIDDAPRQLKENEERENLAKAMKIRAEKSYRVRVKQEQKKWVDLKNKDSKE